MPKKKYVILGGIIVLGLLVLWGYHLFNKPHASAASEQSQETIAAGALYKQFLRDEHAADLRYVGKVLEVRGVFSEMTRNGALRILLLSPQKEGGGISCQLFSPSQDLVNPPKKGDSIVVKGRCTGYLMDVNLVDCVVMDPSQK
jgi:hypothetical protein